MTIHEERPALLFADTESLDSIVPEVSCEGFVSYTFEDPPHPMMALAQMVIGHLKPLPKSVVGIEGDYLPHSLLESIRHECAHLKFQDVTQGVAELRMVKSQDEIQAIKDAVELCDLGQHQTRKLAKPGITELELFEEVRKAMETKAERRVPLLCDFISGPRTAQVGGPPSSRILRQGDLLLVDLAPQYNGYWGDSCNVSVR